ncbi:alpha/beta hydrolase [Thermanaerothrix sp. 4228-RoL]|uniref:Alpha/beta hydrolase n=1 Tax=Thermanaerothrix solaris TaxID=3058434 RepID=A0ABU3NJB5_9CHLR|nr:alpha/beta hydrolase [Thermanaerothrix sp. 4228-RoL]MDT8896951.1 alpha/beta hydrolase [Thermanaerothrix sp. 4228-RoL]
MRAASQLLKLQQLARKHAPAITQPVLIFQGRQDKTIDPMGAEHLFQALGSAQKHLVWLENSRHCVMIDHDFEQVANLSLEFIHQHSA